jgi:hypothetical protein
MNIFRNFGLDRAMNEIANKLFQKVCGDIVIAEAQRVVNLCVQGQQMLREGENIDQEVMMSKNRVIKDSIHENITGK